MKPEPVEQVDELAFYRDVQKRLADVHKQLDTVRNKPSPFPPYTPPPQRRTE